MLGRIPLQPSSGLAKWVTGETNKRYPTFLTWQPDSDSAWQTDSFSSTLFFSFLVTESEGKQPLLPNILL